MWGPYIFYRAMFGQTVNFPPGPVWYNEKFEFCTLNAFIAYRSVVHGVQESLTES